MKIRSVIYWAVSLLIATYAASHAVASSAEIEGVVSPAALSFSTAVTIPDAARSMLLFIGIMAVAYTYQQAWVNFRRKSQS